MFALMTLDSSFRSYNKAITLLAFIHSFWLCPPQHLSDLPLFGFWALITIWILWKYMYYVYLQTVLFCTKPNASVDNSDALSFELRSFSLGTEFCSTGWKKPFEKILFLHHSSIIIKVAFCILYRPNMRYSLGVWCRTSGVSNTARLYKLKLKSTYFSALCLGSLSSG